MLLDDRKENVATEQNKARWLAAAFVLYGLIATGFLALNVPPFQVPDELKHFLRAAQIADGGIIGTRFSVSKADGSSQVTAGGLVDPKLLEAAGTYVRIAHHPDVKATTADWAPNVYWSDNRSLSAFPNTVIYPPFFYLPSAASVLFGRAAHLSVVQTLIASRLLSGVSAVAIGALAIVIADGTAPWIFAILTLPMSLFLMASASQDGLLIACSGLAGALMVKLLRCRTAQNWKQLPLLVVLLGLVALARPPYVAMALIPLAMNKVELRWRILAATGILAAVGVWSAIVAGTTWTSFGAAIVGADPSAQLALVRNDPFMPVTAMFATAKDYWHDYFIMFIGDLGQLDTALPPRYYSAAAVALVIAAMATMLGINRGKIGYGSIFPVVAGLLLSVAAVFGIQYLTWTPPGHDTIEGVQGRYFLPIALIGTVLLPALGNARMARIHNWLLLFVVGFPALSLATLMNAIILRYYLQ